MKYSVMDIEPTSGETGYIGAYEYTVTYRPITDDWAAVVGEYGRIGFGAHEDQCVAIIQAAHNADLN